MEDEIKEAIISQWNEVPSHIKDAGKDFIVIEVFDNSEVPTDLRITICDVAKYIRTRTGSQSGIRTIAGHSGDWRNIKLLVRDVYEYFTIVNKSELISAMGQISTLIDCPVCGTHKVNLTLEDAAIRMAKLLSDDFNFFSAALILADMFGIDKTIAADAMVRVQNKVEIMAEDVMSPDEIDTEISAYKQKTGQ